MLLDQISKAFTGVFVYQHGPHLVRLGPRVPVVQPDDEVTIGIAAAFPLGWRRPGYILTDVLEPIVAVRTSDSEVVMTTLIAIVLIALAARPAEGNSGAWDSTNAFLQALKKTYASALGL